MTTSHEIKINDWHNDSKFLADLDKRSADYKSGKVKGVSWAEAKKQILASDKKPKK